MKTLAAIATVALLSCTASNPPPASATPTASPTLSNPADSKAVDFRIRLDLLLGEHVIAIAKESSAAGRDAEFNAYLHMLTSNGTDLTDLVRSALGDTAAARFGQIWSTQNDHLVHYTIGLVTHDKALSGSSMSSLVSTFVPQMSQFLNSTAQIPVDSMEQLLFQHVLETKAMIDDRFAQSYPRLYADVQIVYGQASLIGDALAPRIVQKFPDKFPGDPSSRAADVRLTLNILLQEHLYLATMATSAATEGRGKEVAAATGALDANAAALRALFSGLFGDATAAQFSQAWAAGDAALLGYASASGASEIQTALTQLTNVLVTQLSNFVQAATGLSPDVSRPPIQAQVQATVTAINDQRARLFGPLATDDRAANALIGVVADLIAGAAIAKLQIP